MRTEIQKTQFSYKSAHFTTDYTAPDRILPQLGEAYAPSHQPPYEDSTLPQLSRGPYQVLV